MKNIGQRLILVSFVLAVLAAVVVFVYLQSQKAPRQAEKKITILVAAETIPPRTLIDKKMIKELEVFDNPVFNDYLKNSSDIVGRYTKDSISKDEGFTNSNILSEDGNELSFKIDKDNRAISISVSGDSGVSELIKPGDYVDVIVYLPEKRDGQKVIRPDLSKMFLQNIQVLAVNKVLTRDENLKDDQSVPASFLVSLSIPRDSIENMVLAESIGSVKLALRPLKTDTSNQTKGSIWQDLTTEQSNDKKVDVSGKTAKISKNTGKYINYKIKPGDTLKKISLSFYGDKNKYSILKNANGINNENLIVTGEIIKIPIQNK